MSRKMHAMVICTAGLLASPAVGDFVGLTTSKLPQDYGMELADAWSVDVFAVFDDPNDRLISVDATMNADTAEFYQNGLGNDFAPNDLIIIVFESLEYDSFVTIGYATDPGDNSTITCPDFQSFNFNNANSFSGCWFDGDQPGTQGIAGNYPGNMVRIARLSTTILDNSACPKVWGDATIQYVDGDTGTLEFGNDAFSRQRPIALCPGNFTWQINDHGVIPFGDIAISQGNQGCPDCLIVSNIGSSGEDGVRIATGVASKMAVRWDTELGDPQCDILTIESQWWLDEGPELSSGRISAETVVEEVIYAKLWADYSALGSTTATVEIYDGGGTLLASKANVPTSCLATATTLPDGAGFNHIGEKPGLVLMWDDSTFIQINGGPAASGKSVKVIPTNGETHELISSMTVRMAGIERLILESIATTQSEPTCFGDLTGDCLVNTADLLQMLGAWGGCAGCPEDLDGDGVVGIADLLLLLGLWD